MNEERLGKGAIPSPIDDRDHQWGIIARGIPSFDWMKGFDVEELYGFKLVTKDQNGSYSCGGQAWAYYGEVLEFRASLNYEQRSAKFIYAQTFVPTGGSDGRTNCKLVKDKGWSLESLCSSYENGNPPSESFMIRVQDITKDAFNSASSVRAFNYANLTTKTIDEIAQAISINNGVVIGIYGDNNGTWRSQFPQFSYIKTWAHWLYAGKAKMINGKKYIGVKNSWGDDVGDHGWQWIGEEFFPVSIFEVWTVYYKQDVVSAQLSIIQRIVQLLLEYFQKKN